MWVALLGALCVRDHGTVVPVAAARQRAILGVLAVRAGQVVSFDELADTVWDGSPPPAARSTTRGYVKRLRCALGPGLAERVVTQAPGYLLQASADEVDLQVFDRLCTEAGAAVRAAAWQRASQLLADALGLWRGEPLSDLNSESLRAALLPRLEAQRVQAVQWRAEAGLALGRHAELVPELTALAAAHPLQERFWALLILALYRSGRPGEALTAYHQARRTLARELGVEPGPDLRELHRRVLAADPALIAAASLAGAPALLASAQVTETAQDVPGSSLSLLPGSEGALPGSAAAREGDGAGAPRQLPNAVSGFAGRTAALQALDDLADAGNNAVVISAIAGTAGVGKTALAVHWAHRVAGQFPDGQLYVNLRGFGPAGSALTPAEAIRELLDALRVPADQIPAHPEARVSLYRSLLAGRRVLVILDNARDSAQVRPLLPGSPSCCVLITSRNRLASLVATEGTHPLLLDLLTEQEARELLASRLGRQRVAAEAAAVDALIGICARLPLALAIAAAYAATSPGLPLSALVARLRDARSRLDALNAGDPATDIRAVFSWSYQNLAQPPARMFRLLGLHAGPDITAPAAASLAGVPLPEAQRGLGELTATCMLAEHLPGRFTFHDLLSDFAAELASSRDGQAEREAAVDRLLSHYLHSAHAAALALSPFRRPINLTALRPGVTPEQAASYDEGLAWFDAEHRVLMAAISGSREHRRDGYAWQLSWALADFLDRRGYWDDYATTQHTALAATSRLGDRAGQAHAHHHLGQAYTGLGCSQDARWHFEQALSLHRELGDRMGEARAHLDMAKVLGERERRYREAVGHDEQALALMRAAGDRHGEARALNSLGCDLTQLGEHARAIDCCREALSMLCELGDSYAQAAVWHSLGYAYHRQGSYAEAAVSYQHTLDLIAESGDRYHLASTLAALGDSQHAARQHEQAREAWQRALAVLDEIRHPDADQVRGKLSSVVASPGRSNQMP